jgi:hypothetical protein
VTQSQAAFLANIAGVPDYMEAFAAMVDESRADLIRELRDTVARGQHRESAIIEGKIQALESVPDLIRQDRGFRRPETVSA